MGTVQSMGSMYGDPLRQKSPNRGINVCSPVLKSINFSSENCCLAFRLQPTCTGNRHFHAHFHKQGRASYIIITDLTHDKTVTCAIHDDEEIEVLPQKLLQLTDLQVCNVVAFHRGVLIVQLFCVNEMKFVIISLKDNTWKLTYNRKYTSQKLQLYECFMSSDGNYVLVKQNQIHATLYNRNTSDKEGFTLLKVDLDEGSYKKVYCENLNTHTVMSNYRVAVAFDPRTANDLVVFMHSAADRALFGLYKLEKDYFLFTIAIFIKENPAIPGKYQNLQFLKDGSAVILSVLGSTGYHPQSVSVLCWNRFVTVYWFDPDCFDKIGSFTYVSPTGYEQYAPLISNSGKYACCGARVYGLEEMNPGLLGVKTLKRICYDLIVDAVLPEDLDKLPLPKPMITYLEKN